MDALKWKNPNRKRLKNAKFNDPNYVKGYDLDLEDFGLLVTKLRNGERLTEVENDRYGIYILTVIEMVLEGPKFKNKTASEKSEIREQQYMELLTGLPMYDCNRGPIYPYAYRIGYTAACHYYTALTDSYRKQKAIEEHCQEEYDFYLDEYSTHKVSNNNVRE